jgi:Tol biopolymer transport system component
VCATSTPSGPFRPAAEHTLVGHSGVYNSYPDWSPGGGKVVYARNSNTEHDTDIFIVDLGSGNVTRVTRNSGINDSMPAYSPNGRFLVWARGDTDADVTDDLEIRNLVTDTTTTLTSGGGRMDEEPDWGTKP